jgi:hypothetical protein
MRKSVCMATAFVVWLIGGALQARAQVTTGSIVGTVTDSSDQVVPGAQVVIRDLNKNTLTNVVSDASGAYVAPFLVPGTYEVTVELQGFKKWVRGGLLLQVNDRLRVDARLEVGGLEETTSVVASSPIHRKWAP